MMIATLDTLVSCSEGMNVIIPSIDRTATSQPFLPMLVKSRRPAAPCVNTRMTVMVAAPNNPRQNRMVQEFEREQFCKERRGAPRHSRSDDKGGARAALRSCFGHGGSYAYPRACFSTFALLAGTPNSLRQTSASTATPSRICWCEGLAKHSRNRLPA